MQPNLVGKFRQPLNHTSKSISEFEGLLDHVRSVTPHFLERLHALRRHALVGDTRGIGLVGCVEGRLQGPGDRFARDLEFGRAIDEVCEEQGLIVRPLVNMCVFSPPLIITRMPVLVGQTVAAGMTLAELADYSELYLEGRTFERDGKALSRVAENHWTISALFESGERDRDTVSNLDLVYSSNAIHVESRTLPFYVRLPNEMVRTIPSPDGHTFVEWRYRPGRRVQLLVPIEELKDQPLA